jgi:uncharacterized Ntn-hydrolase superfamily protein
MTFSIAARDAATGMFGVAVTSSSPAVAARCACARAGVGAACSQNITDPRLGPALLDRLERGMFAAEALDQVVAETSDSAYRQLTVVDRWGGTAAYSGGRTLGTHETMQTLDAVVAGNLLADQGVPAKMLAAFEERLNERFGDRLLAAMQAGLDAGGEAGPVHSAGLLIVRDVPWPVADLRVDWSDDPIGDLVKLWRLWRPQMDAYVTRALDPGAAPSYGVAGDE